MLRAVYRLVLHACPPEVRRQYGAEMEEVFLHCLDVERRRRSPLGRAATCLWGAIDLLIFAIRARWQGWGTEDRSRTRRPLVLTRDIRGSLRLMRSQPALSAAI